MIQRDTLDSISKENQNKIRSLEKKLADSEQLAEATIAQQ